MANVAANSKVVTGQFTSGKLLLLGGSPLATPTPSSGKAIILGFRVPIGGVESASLTVGQLFPTGLD